MKCKFCGNEITSIHKNAGHSDECPQTKKLKNLKKKLKADKEEWRTCPRCKAIFQYHPNLPIIIRQDICEMCIEAIKCVSES